MTRGTSPFRLIGVCPNLAMLAAVVESAQATEEAKMREPDEQLQREYDTKRRLNALTAAGFVEPQEILDRLGELAKRLLVSLDDLINAVVKLRQHPEQTVELRQTVDGQPLLAGETWPTKPPLYWHPKFRRLS